MGRDKTSDLLWTHHEPRGGGNLFNPAGNLGSLQFLFDSSNPLQQYTTDGAVSLASASSQYLQGTVWLTTAPFTIAGWINPVDFAATRNVFGIGANAASPIQMGVTTTSKLRFTANNFTNTTNSVGSIGSAGTWTHFAVVHDGVNCNYYINGIFDSAFVAPISLGSPTNSTIGSVSGGGNYWNGLIDAFGVWTNTALTAGQVSTLYNSGNGLKSNQIAASGLPTPSNYYDFDNPTISSAGIGKDYIGSNNLTPNAAPTYVAGKVTGTVLINGDAIASILDQSSNANNGSQATGANRYTYLTNQINGQAALNASGVANSGYSLGSLITATNPFTCYAVFKRANSSVVITLGDQAGSFYYSGVIYSDNNAYVRNSTAVNQPYTGSTGNIAIRFRRDASNVCYCAASGMAEITLGTVSGNILLNMLFNYSNNIVNAMTLNNQASLLSLQLADTISNNQDGAMRNYIKNKFGLTIP